MSQEYEEMQVEKWVNLEDVAKQFPKSMSGFGKARYKSKP